MQVIYFRHSTGANCQIVPFLDLSQNLQGYSSTNTCAFDKSLRIQTRVDLSTLCASITGKPRPWILLPGASFSPCCPNGQNQSLEHMELRSGDTCTGDFSKLSCPVSCEVTVEKSLVQVIYLRHSTGVIPSNRPFSGFDAEFASAARERRHLYGQLFDR